ncbi:SURF1 family protein [Glaciibacter psychrotolerans]|nr:SURF1 family protein [Leifsonia psychrotolerans]
MMVRPRWVAALLLCLAIAAGFALLGQWQLDRAIASGTVVERTTETAVPLADLVQPDGPPQSVANGHKVTLTGSYVSGDEQIIAKRLNAGESGFWVVSHFVDSAGASIAVARGWAPTLKAAQAAEKELQVHAAVQIELAGRFVEAEAPVVPADGHDPHEMTTVAPAALINLWPGFNEQPVYFGFIVDELAAPGLAVIDAPAPVDEVELNWLNVFYALEWAVFAGFAVFLWFRLVKDAVEREEELAELAAVAAANEAITQK